MHLPDSELFVVIVFVVLIVSSVPKQVWFEMFWQIRQCFNKYDKKVIFFEIKAATFQS